MIFFKDILNFSFVILLFFHLDLYKTNTQGSLINYYIEYIDALFSLLLFGVCIYNKGIYKKIKPYINFLNFYVLLLILFLGLESIYTLIKYNIEIYNVIRSFSKYIVYVLFSYPLLYIFICEKGYNKFFRKLIFMFLIALFLKTITAVSFNLFGTPLFPAYLLREKDYGSILSLRDETARIFDGCFGGYNLVLLIYFSFTENIKWKKYILILFTVLDFMYIVFIDQGRSQLLSVITAGIGMCLFYSKKIAFKKSLIIFFVIALTMRYIKDFFLSFNIDSPYAYSTIARLYALEYYYNLWSENIFFGIGLLNGGVRSEFSYIIHGPKDMAHIDDVGIIGFFFYLGIVGMTIWISLYLRMVKVFYFSLKKMKIESLMLLGHLIYFTVRSITSVTVFESDYTFLLPFYIALFEFIYIFPK